LYRPWSIAFSPMGEMQFDGGAMILVVWMALYRASASSP
jgi:hypothetical protein